MCRHLAYLGPPVPLSTHLFDAPHALISQAKTPRSVPLCSGDGFGVGWYEDGQPIRYRTTTPIWEDDVFRARAASVRASAMIASARLATRGMTIEDTSTAPLCADGILFALNGFVDGFGAGARATLEAMLTRRRRASIEGSADTGVLFALVLDAIDLDASLREALATTHAIVRRVSAAPMNLLITDGTQIAATASGHSLAVRASEGSVLVSSEPLDDDPAWQQIPDGSLIDAAPGTVRIVSLGSVFVEPESLCGQPVTPLIGSDR